MPGTPEADRTAAPDVLGAIALGGALGALARWALLEAFAADPASGAVPWATVTVNATGSFLLGVLVVLVALRPGRRLLRPFLGVGVLGGYTTFSAAALDVHELLRTGHAGAAAGYLAASLLASLLAVWVGLVVARVAVDRRPGGAAR